MPEKKHPPAWELSFLIIGEQDEAEALYDQMQEIACNCDGREDGPECRCPVSSMHQLKDEEL